MTSSVAAVVVTHRAGPELARCLEALTPQVDELVVVANPPAPSVDARLIVNERALGFAANANKGIAATTAPFVVVANPDTLPREGAVETLRKFAELHPRAGIVGPQLLFPDGRWQPSRRSFPTVSGTIVRRTPLRKVLRPETRQLDHYLLEDRPTVSDPEAPTEPLTPPMDEPSPPPVGDVDVAPEPPSDEPDAPLGR